MTICGGPQHWVSCPLVFVGLLSRAPSTSLLPTLGFLQAEEGGLYSLGSYNRGFLYLVF